MTDLLIGTDPELFLMNRETGKFVSAHDIVPGTKQAPYLVDCGAVQVDGVAAEFNTFPASSVDTFVSNHKTVLDQLAEIVREASDLPLDLIPVPTAEFDPEYWASLPPEPKVLGCEPDFSGYTNKPNSKPNANLPFRTGGFHVHVGWGDGFSVNSDAHFGKCQAVARQLDALIYGVSTLWDGDEKRRQLYGKMGSFRPKLYGMEWRPLSNAVLQDEEVLRWVYSMTVAGVTLLFDKGVELTYNPMQSPLEIAEYYEKKYDLPPVPTSVAKLDTGAEYVGEGVNDAEAA